MKALFLILFCLVFLSSCAELEETGRRLGKVKAIFNESKVTPTPDIPSFSIQSGVTPSPTFLIPEPLSLETPIF